MTDVTCYSASMATAQPGFATPVEDYVIADLQRAARTWSLAGPLGVLVSINLENGEMKFGENYSPDAAARTFWEAVGHYRK